MTEDWEPYQYLENGELKGIAVDLLVLMLEKAGSQQGREDIRIGPWARGYTLLQKRKNTILFSTTRTVEREKLFKWVGPIFQNTTYLIGKKSSNIVIQTKDDIKKYQVGTIIDDAGEQYMLKLGVPLTDLQRNEKAVYNIKKLNLGRIDLVVCGWVAFVHDAKEANVDYNLYAPVFTVDIADVSYAFHKRTPNWVIQEFQTALNELKSEGKHRALFKKYRQQLEFQFE